MRLSRITSRLVVPLMAVLAVSCAPGPERSANGPPQRIVSMAPGLTETVYAVGCGDRLVGVTDFCKYPEEALEVESIGGYLDPNVEKVVALEPDLILVMESQTDLVERFQGFGFRTKVVSQNTVEAILKSFDKVAHACGEQERGATLRRSVEARLAAISSKVEGKERPSVLAVIGRQVGAGKVTSVWAAAQSTFFGEIIVLAGGRNVVETGIEGAYPEISLEGVIHLDPDVILDVVPEEQGGDLSSDAIVEDWRDLASLRAVRSNRLSVLRQPFIVIPGPRVAEIVEVVARVLHPEAGW